MASLAVALSLASAGFLIFSAKSSIELIQKRNLDLAANTGLMLLMTAACMLGAYYSVPYIMEVGLIEILVDVGVLSLINATIIIPSILFNIVQNKGLACIKNPGFYTLAILSAACVTGLYYTADAILSSGIQMPILESIGLVFGPTSLVTLTILIMLPSLVASRDLVA